MRDRTILSLCDGTGAWSQPYCDAGYTVCRIDIETGQDVRLLKIPSTQIHGVLAAPPCTVFAASGNRWPRTEDAMRDGLSVVDACLRIVMVTEPIWWALENPVGKLVHYLGPSKMRFDPCDFGPDVKDAYTKRTCLWGNFTVPMRAPIPAQDGSKLHRLPPTADRAKLRSITPTGFARAFFKANP